MVRIQFRGIIGPFFFANEQEEAVTVNDDRYRPMLNEFLFTKIEAEDIGNIWFQQDGGTFHTEEARPPRSCDLTPLDYYLWGAVKDKCYADKPETFDTLKVNIHGRYFRNLGVRFTDSGSLYELGKLSY